MTYRFCELGQFDGKMCTKWNYNHPTYHQLCKTPGMNVPKAHCSSPAIKPPVQSLKDSLISDSDGKTWLMAENKGGLVLGCEQEERYQITHVKWKPQNNAGLIITS